MRSNDERAASCFQARGELDGIGRNDRTRLRAASPGRQNASQLQVSPNPSAGSFQVSYYASEPGNREAMIQVTNLVGQVVRQQSARLEAGISRFEVDLAELPEGIYVLQVDGLATEKLLKH